jgi:hypothetical protein
MEGHENVHGHALACRWVNGLHESVGLHYWPCKELTGSRGYGWFPEQGLLYYRPGRAMSKYRHYDPGQDRRIAAKSRDTPWRSKDPNFLRLVVNTILTGDLGGLAALADGIELGEIRWDVPKVMGPRRARHLSRVRELAAGHRSTRVGIRPIDDEDRLFIPGQRK